MRLGRPLSTKFFDRPCLEVARELVGKLVVRTLADGSQMVGRLVEVEAYLGDGSDPGSHSHRGRTLRNQSMFGPPGRLYVYRIYGVHLCANLVCEPEGSGAAVLLRAMEPLGGIAQMRAHRGLSAAARGKQISTGPGRLCAALGLDLSHDGRSALRGGVLTLRDVAHGSVREELRTGPRVGLSRGAELPYRFYLHGNAYVSPWRPGGRRRRSELPSRVR